MSRKLSYSADAFAARVRMSKEFALFIVVEGRDFDSPFYEGAARSSELVRDSGYQIWLVEQITRTTPDGEEKSAGGKASVLELHDLYKKRRLLQSKNSAGKRSIVFCIDRDLDDIGKSVRRSSHIIYTPMADAESCAYIHGDLTRAIARAASLDEASARSFASNHASWANDLANLWRDWIELCCLAAAHRAYCHIGTTKRSIVNKDTYGLPIKSEISKAKRVVLLKSQLPQQEHDHVEKRIKERLQRIYGRGNQHRLLGKHWIPDYLLHLLNGFFDDNPVALANFKHRAPIAFMDALDFDGRWASYYRTRFEALIS